MKHKLLVGGVALVVAASAGGAYAATQSGSDSRQAFLNDVAKRLNVSPSQLRAAVSGALLDRLNAAVKAGELTQAQADRLRQRIEQNGALPFGGRLLGGPMWRGRLEPGGPRQALLPAAGYLGLTPLQLLQDMRSGKTLAQIAQAQGKSVTGLEQVLLTAAKTRLTRLAAAGVITQAQEQRRLNRLSSRIDRLVNHARIAPVGPLALGPGPGGPGGPDGPDGPGAPGGLTPAPPPGAPSSGGPIGPPPAA